MKMFLWNDKANMSNNYHDGGSAFAIAETLGAARELFRAQPEELFSIYMYDHDDEEDKREKLTKMEQMAVFTTEPDIVYTVQDDAAPCAYVFPNAGCC